MDEPPEILSETATPAKIVERLDFIRERYRMGQMDVGSLNEALKLFQFRDVLGEVWTPGVRTNQWYRWDGRQWIPGNPPERLQVPQMPLGISTGSSVPSHKPGGSGPRAVQCPTCGASNIGKRFCTACGTKLAQAS